MCTVDMSASIAIINAIALSLAVNSNMVWYYGLP